MNLVGLRKKMFSKETLLCFEVWLSQSNVALELLGVQSRVFVRCLGCRACSHLRGFERAGSRGAGCRHPSWCSSTFTNLWGFGFLFL